MKNKCIPALAFAAAAVAPAASQAEVSANFGWVSEYIYRGIFQEDSSASAGIDYEGNGFYVGTWGADVGDGLETDLYFGYGGGEDFTWSVGFTGYYYTDDFDDTYEEINLGIGYGIFALDYADGEYDGFGSPSDYSFTSVTVSPESWPYFKLGSYGKDADGEYLEIGYGFELMELDLSIALVYSDDLNVNERPLPVDLDPTWESGDYALVFGVSKSLALGGE